MATEIAPEIATTSLATPVETPAETFLASPELRPRAGDLFNVDAALTEEERAVRDSCAASSTRRCCRSSASTTSTGTFPSDLIPKMGELGVFGANLPEEYGCAGLNNVQYGLIMQELERGDSGIRSFASVQGALVMYPIYAFGSRRRSASGCRDGPRRGDRLLRPHRARLRQQPERA
jgi:glutaryl-CoA dehydrogenase